MPHAFMKKVCKNEGIKLPKKGDYGVGMLFLSPDKDTREESLERLTKIIDGEKQKLLGIREVPVYDVCIGNSAREAMPHIVQVFIGKGDESLDADSFERKLYIIGKLAEKEIRKSGLDNYFYFASLSARTVVYKGMLTPDQVNEFYLDLKDVDMETAIALVHSRFSTNTFPSWERAHPNRYIIHNGEINTIRGNVNWVKARERMFATPEFEGDMDKILPVINEDGSDSAMLDNYLQFLHLSGFSLPRAVMMTIPEPWENNADMDPAMKAFYEYHSCITEPWDGPAAVAFTDGRYVGATLDRNGLRPARYYLTSDDMIILSSEVGVTDVDESTIIKKERLHPGKMLLIDTEKGKIISDEEIKKEEALHKPYAEWVKKTLVELDNLPLNTDKKGDTWHDLVHKLKDDAKGNVNEHLLLKNFIVLENMFVNRENSVDKLSLLTRQKAFGYTWEDVNTTIKSIVEKADDPIGAMGADIPLAVLSEKPQLLYNYFKQLFAQVTNPPIDAIREQIVTSTYTLFGCEQNLLTSSELNCRKVRALSPILTNEELEKLRNIDLEGFKSITIPSLFNVKQENDMETAMDTIFEAADIAIENGYNIIILSDKGVDKDKAPIPALLVASGLHHHLIRKGTRMKVSIVLESGEPREVHHFACLVGYGVNGINPYMAYEAIKELSDEKLLEYSYEDGVKRFNKACTKGIVKIMSKMGISTIQSYQGAQIFEALGISESVVNKYFTGTTTRIGGMGIEHIQKEVLLRHAEAFDKVNGKKALKTGGDYKWRAKGEYHMFNPESIYKLQMACRTGNYKLYKEYAKEMDEHQQHQCTIRGMLDIKTIDKPIAIDQVESVESIVKRFKTGAMSYGSISQEAHECLAIAMNRLGGKSNSGEGGENPERYIPDENGDSRSSAIKQVASGRFGVHIHYLQNAKEIQIKMAQGAKPGEGGHLPGGKVYPWIAKARHSTPGVGLISPPPHHDIYSIEDLAQLIHDLKNANRDARVTVKLVSEAGVGTIAVGVAKGRADVILVSGYDGGTGAAPRNSIYNAGLPWELGLAEAHQTLIKNGLRNKVVIETDGKLMTGRDVVIAAILGAEEFGFATAPLITLGCAMMRVCNLDTCPFGVATQNPELRKKFPGKPEYVMNFMIFVASELREYMSKLGVRTVDELVGRIDLIKPKAGITGTAAQVDLSNIINSDYVSEKVEYNKKSKYDFKLENTLDEKVLMKEFEKNLKSGEKKSITVNVKNTDRSFGTIFGSEITRKYYNTLADDTYKIVCNGSGGQSFGAFIPNGLTLELVGDSNDYFGKGLSGGKLVVYPPKDSTFKAEDNIIIGNVALYGATSGKAFIDGVAGERFCVRNSGAVAVVEGVGDHGCEYMTGGCVVVIGKTGKNFAAGMSGGVAYVLDEDRHLYTRLNKEMVLFSEVKEKYDIIQLKDLIQQHVDATGSEKGKRILDNFEEYLPKFKKIIPHDYKKMMSAIASMEEKGMSSDQAQIEAFYQIINGKQ
jgi:glutamate synthase (ferredoxin)